MSQFTMSFSGDVRKPVVKDIGGKKAIEFQLMKKNYGKPDAEASFTWLRVTVFDAKDWQVDQCQEGNFVAGTGEFSLRSYEKDGQKRQSAEVRATSFQLDAPYSAPSATPAPTPRPARAAPAPTNDDEPPF